MRTLASILLLALSTAVLGGPRTSARYAVATETTGAGGGLQSSARYTNNGALGELGGVTSIGSLTARDGYVGQVTEAVSLQIAAAPSPVNENATTQLSAAQLFSDGSRTVVPASSVAWSVVSGPVAAIGSGGVASTGAVYRDTSATVRGAFLSLSGTAALTVLNVGSDDYGSYAGDGLPDDWQVTYFGTGNPLAAPGVDASGNGATNLFKYVAGLNPLDPAARFSLTLASANQLVFSPRLTGRTYTVQSSANLVAWAPLGSSATADNGIQRTVTDLAPGTAPRFYRVLLSLP